MLKNLNKKFIKIAVVITVLGIISNLLFPLTVVNAKEQDRTSFNKIEELANITTEITNKDYTDNLLNNIKKFINEEKLVLNVLSEELDYDNATYLTIDNNTDLYTSVVIPIMGKRFSFISNLTLVFDNKEELISYSEYLITTNNDNKFVISNYLDGVLTNSEITNIDYINNTDLKNGLNEIKELSSNVIAPRSVGAVGGCIAAIAGVNAGVAYLIAGACAASCPVVVPICVACIGAVATMGAADVAGIVACFKLL